MILHYAGEARAVPALKGSCYAKAGWRSFLELGVSAPSDDMARGDSLWGGRAGGRREGHASKGQIYASETDRHARGP